MLQLILGVAGTGKTTLLLQQMRQRAGQGKQCVFLVPEQFSSSAEAMVYNQLGDADSAWVEVVSFRTLGERIFKASGGLSTKVLTDADRTVFVRRALDALGTDVNTFSRYRHNTAFCSLCAQTIGELKTAGAGPRELEQIGLQAGEPKLGELALIYQAYEQAIAGVAMDEQDKLQLAAERAGCGYFDGKACYIDNFDGFTAPEYALLEQMIRYAAEVTVALCCDDLLEKDGGLGRFSPVRSTANRLIQKANRGQVRVKAPIELKTSYRCEENGPAAVGELLVYGEAEECETAVQGLTMTPCNDEWEEMRLVAAEMHRLAQQGVPYTRMAVVCRDVSKYESAVRRAFALYAIPLFVDASATIEYTSPVAFIRGALRLLREGITSEPILALLKTGLCGYTKAEIAALENYVYTWSPKAADWRGAFENNPGGLMARMDDAAQRQLELAEKVRGQMVPVLEKFIGASRGKSAAVVSRQLYLLLDSFNAAENDEEEKSGFTLDGEPLIEESRRAWDVAMDLLDQMTLLVGKEALAPTEYDELFLLLVRATDFGRVPQTLECAIFTSADRMRLADPDYCFVVGLCEGEFPMQVGYSGLLTHTDRELLVASGIEMPGSFENRVLLEEMFFYRALTSPRKGLYLSWPVRQAGAAKMMTSALEPIHLALQPPVLQVPLVQQVSTPASAFEELGKLYREDTPEAATLYTALQNSNLPKASAGLELLERVENNGEFLLKDAAPVRQLLGDTISLSATQADRYYQCQFSYYMERVLRVLPRRKAELSPMESGTFVHYMLEKVMEETGDSFSSQTDEEITTLTTRLAQKFVEENLPDDTRRSRVLLGWIVTATIELLCFLRDNAAQSDFVVDATELSIADSEGGIAPLELEGPDGVRIRVSGQVDRVDVLRRGDKTYLCVLDYKTGTKKFNLDDIYCGLNMQMMIYMDALCKNAAERYPNAVPAGVLYLTSDPAPTTGSRSVQAGPVYKMDGLLLQDSDVLRALDKSGEGIFLPFKHKDGTPLRAGKKLADLEKMGQIANHVEQRLQQMVQGVYRGVFTARPQVKGQARPCTYCPYRAACRHEDGKNEGTIQAPADAFTVPKGEGGDAHE